MEPVSIPANRGTLEDPEVLQNVPGHVIPILQREYDDFKTEATKFLGGRDARRRVHQVPPQAGRLRPAPARRADDPREAPLRRRHARADGGVRRRRREVRAAAQGPHHHAPEHPDAPHPAARSREGDPRARRARASPAARAAATRCATSPATRGRAWRRTSCSTSPPTPARTCATSCATPPRRRCRARSRPPSTRAPRDRAISGIHDVAFRARVREIDGRGEVRGVEMLVGGGTSIMPRVAQVLYDFVELDNGEYLKVTEAVMRIFDRQEWLRVNRARARIKVFVDKYGIDELRNQVEEELQGDWVARTRLLDRAAPVPRRRARERARRRPPATAAPTATSPSSSASARRTCASRSRRAS